MDSMNQAAFKVAFRPSGETLCVNQTDIKAPHNFAPLVTRQYWLNVGEGLGPGYAVHAEHHTEHKVTKVYCRHCLEVRELNG